MAHSKLSTRIHEVRREDIIAAAIVVINRLGYASASVDKIAKEAGTTKGTVLYHFGSRKEVNKALIESLYQIGQKYIRTKIENLRSCRELLSVYLAENLRFIVDNREHISAVHKVLNDLPLREYGEQPAKWLIDLFKKGQKERVFCAFDPVVMAVAVRSFIDAASFYFESNENLANVDHVIQEVQQLFDRAVRNK